MPTPATLCFEGFCSSLLSQLPLSLWPKGAGDKKCPPPAGLIPPSADERGRESTATSAQKRHRHDKTTPERETYPT